MAKSKGVQAPFFSSAHVPDRRHDGLLAQTMQAFQSGRFADALATSEGLCRAHPHLSSPALLRATILQACRPTLAQSAWLDAWQREPLNPALQDALVRSQLRTGSTRRAAQHGPLFLPQRCQQGTHVSLLPLLEQAGVPRAGACWRSGDAIEIRCFGLRNAAEPMRVVVAGEHGEQAHEVGASGSLRVEMPQACGTWSVAFDGGALLQGSPIVFPQPAQGTRPPAEPGVDIIVPVYRGLRGVQACLRSVLESLPLNRTPARVIVVNDATPEPALALWLESLVSQPGGITLLHNRFNLGFIESVNRALRHGRRDALLLNADTLVHGDWIDRLVAALHSSPAVASVMPWSNNGQIGNLVRGDAVAAPDREALARIDSAAAALHARGETADAEIPTCSGFAMLMRRSVIDQIGVLDGVALTRGYLEEVDWCLRARGAGFTHLLASGVFVAHEGGTSFGAEKQLRVSQNRATIVARYPGYYTEYASFLRSDPLTGTRNRLLDAVNQLDCGWPLPAIAVQQRIDPGESLRGTSRRVAVWQLRAGSDASQRLLALARLIASLGDSASLRLMVFGDASEALWHTGVVDVVPLAHGDETVLTDSLLASLAGCTEVLADVATPVPDGVPCTRLARGFDAAQWLYERGWLTVPDELLEAA